MKEEEAGQLREQFEQMGTQINQMSDMAEKYRESQMKNAQMVK